MRGYILDANHVSAQFAKDPSFLKRFRSVPADTQWRVCAITLGEIEAGLRITNTTDYKKREEYTAFVANEFIHHCLEITDKTRIFYAQIIERIWGKHPPANKTIKSDKHLVNLGVDMNDVWIVASAWERGLTLLTTDKMACIRNLVTEVKMECWTQESSASVSTEPSPLSSR